MNKGAPMETLVFCLSDELPSVFLRRNVVVEYEYYASVREGIVYSTT